MKRLLPLAFLLAVACGGAGPRQYASNDLMLTAAFAAHHACSCLFVMEQPEAWCRDWVRASPDVTRWSADFTRKRVEASAFMLWSAKARYVDARQGCVPE